MTKKIIQPRTLSGFMELLPQDQITFNYLMDIIRNGYESFGFTPLDTPVLELSEVLLAKAGGETEKQIYAFTKGDTDLAMRFDLTVPLAKYVALNYSSLTFPFKRYQIGKVYRGERPQHGRFREFYQADIDIIGNEKLDILYDAEMPAVIYQTFLKMGLPSFTIHINNRKILSGFFEHLNCSDKITDILRIIDKADKIGLPAVKEELQKIGTPETNIKDILSFTKIKGTNDEILDSLKNLKIENENFALGLSELSAVVSAIRNQGVPEEYFHINLSIARGLDYYTGTVYETTLKDYPEVGSICSGGRYDNLAGFYTRQKLPGVGISIGLSRLFSQLKDKGLLPKTPKTLLKVLILPMDKDTSLSFELATNLRNQYIKTEVFLEQTKFKNKMNYANKIGVPFVAIIGEDEIKNRSATIKNMLTGEQQTVSIEDVHTLIK